MAYDDSKRYATKDSYYKYSGIDLDLEIKKSQTDNETKAVDIFIRRVSEWLNEYLEMNYDVTEFEDDIFQKAIHYQIDFMRKNGDLSVSAANEQRVLAKNALTVLRNNGMANPLIQVKRRYRRWR